MLVKAEKSAPGVQDTRLIKTDVVIIGAGTAGLSAYRAVKAAGKRALLIEGGPHGTTCARVGCMPSKLLIAAAEAAHTVQSAAAFGVQVSEVQIDGAAVMERVRRERDRFVGFVLDSVDRIPEEDKLQGYARFVSDTVLAVGEHTQVEAERVIIATGSMPFVPALYAKLGDRVIINDDVFQWKDLPDSLLVVGTGVIGLEIGQALARLGVRVLFISHSAGLGGLSDLRVKESALAAFSQEFDLQLETRVLDARREGDRVHVTYSALDELERSDVFDYVLVAAGRRPNLSSLRLENTTAQLNDTYAMPAYNAATLQLDGIPVFIAGDVNDTLTILHEAADDGQIAGRNAASYPDVTAYPRRTPMSVVFTDPQLAQVGAHFKDLPPQAVIGEVDFSNQGRSRVMLKNRGMLRLYAQRDDGLFLGAEMAGPGMEHMAHLLAWSLQQKLTIDQMLEMPFYHPVVEEGLRTALRVAAAQRAEA